MAEKTKDKTEGLVVQPLIKHNRDRAVELIKGGHQSYLPTHVTCEDCTLPLVRLRGAKLADGHPPRIPVKCLACHTNHHMTVTETDAAEFKRVEDEADAATTTPA